MRLRASAAVLLAVLAAGCGSSSSNNNSSMTNPSPSNGATVTIVSGARSLTTTAYSPNPISVSVGTTIMWVNNDSTAHTATSNNGAFDTGAISAGGSFSKQFSTAGSFPYHCSFHPGMVATINVQ
jgi:plastocyanin